MKISRRYILLIGLLPLLQSCESRNFQAPKNLLIGHWIDANGKIELYFDGSQLIMTVKNLEGKGRFNYSVASENIFERSVKINGIDPVGPQKGFKGRDRIYTFSLDGRTMVENVTDYIDDKVFPYPPINSHYVDSRTSPP